MDPGKTERLTNEQVEVLALWAGSEEYDQVAALALEVQQARQRRCGNCRWWDVEEDPGGVPVSRMCVNLTDRYDDPVVTEADWFCADFTPKEPK